MVESETANNRHMRYAANNIALAPSMKPKSIAYINNNIRTATAQR